MKRQKRPKLDKILATSNDRQKQMRSAAKFIQQKFGQYRCHKILLILGSGLGESIDGLKYQKTIDYEDIPFWPVPTAEGHAGQLVSGRLHGKWILIMKGRVHYYEGYKPQEIVFPVYVSYLLGARRLIITNASGGLNTSYKTGDIMIISDMLNLLFDSPLVGPNIEKYGTRFPAMEKPYDKKYILLMMKIGEDLKIPLRVGTFTAIKGPEYETPAMMRFMINGGADATGMSTIFETIAANHCRKRGRFRVAGLSIVTDMCIPDNPEHVSHKKVIKEAGKASHKVGQLITTFIKKL